MKQPRNRVIIVYFCFLYIKSTTHISFALQMIQTPFYAKLLQNGHLLRELKKTCQYLSISVFLYLTQHWSTLTVCAFTSQIYDWKHVATFVFLGGGNSCYYLTECHSKSELSHLLLRFLNKTNNQKQKTTSPCLTYADDLIQTSQSQKPPSPPSPALPKPGPKKGILIKTIETKDGKVISESSHLSEE